VTLFEFDANGIYTCVAGKWFTIHFEPCFRDLARLPAQHARQHREPQL
jgi:hypothetical protein